MLFEFKKSLILSHITFSNTSEDAVSNDIGLSLDMQDFSPFLYRSLTFEHLSRSANTPTAIDWLQR
jgi:hypothetical protein